MLPSKVGLTIRMAFIEAVVKAKLRPVWIAFENVCGIVRHKHYNLQKLLTWAGYVPESLNALMISLISPERSDQRPSSTKSMRENTEDAAEPLKKP